MRVYRVFWAIAALGLAAGCSKDKDRGGAAAGPPPPAASSAADAKLCASGGGKLADADAARFFPATIEGFCLDPNGTGEAYGEGASEPIDRVCDLFDGECEVYKGFHVRRVVEVRYVDGTGSPATIDVHFSKFGTTEYAYAMFTKRVVGDGDPVDPATPLPIEGGSAAALGLGNAYLWKGQYLAEITYNDERVAQEAPLKAASDKLLRPLVKMIGDKLPGDSLPLPAVAALPTEDRVTLGVRYVTDDVLGIGGLGGGAFGYYQQGERRYRYVALLSRDTDQAKDAMKTLSARPGAERIKHLADSGVRLMDESDGPAVEWVFARRGARVLGIGDESRVLRRGMTAAEHEKVVLTRDEKVKRVRAALAP